MASASIPVVPERPVRFGVQGGPFGDAVALRAHARLVESLGYDELFSFDHIGVFDGGDRADGRVVPDPFVPLVVAAEATTTLRIGPLVLNNEFHQPALLARTAATVDRLSGGRLVLGMGTGYAGAEHDAIGVPIRDPGPRVTRFEESIVILRSLLDTGAADHDGATETVRFDDVGVTPAQDRVPILIGGHGRRVVGIAGRHADVFQFTGLTHGPDGTPAPGGFGLADLDRRRGWLEDAAGERIDSIERSALVQVADVDGDGSAARDAADRTRLAREVIDESPFVLIGSVEQIVDKIGQLRDRLGITHYVVRDAEGFAPVVDALTGA